HKSCLFYTAAVSTDPGLELMLYLLRHLKAAFVVGVLRQGEQDIRLGTVGIKAFISLFVVLIEQNHTVLALGDLEVGLGSVKPHHPGLCSIGGIVRDGVDVD